MSHNCGRTRILKLQLITSDCSIILDVARDVEILCTVRLCPSDDLPTQRSYQDAWKKKQKTNVTMSMQRLDSNTLAFNSPPTSVSCASDMNALAGLRCAVD